MKTLIVVFLVIYITYWVIRYLTKRAIQRVVERQYKQFQGYQHAGAGQGTSQGRGQSHYYQSPKEGQKQKRQKSAADGGSKGDPSEAPNYKGYEGGEYVDFEEIND